MDYVQSWFLTRTLLKQATATWNTEGVKNQQQNIIFKILDIL